MPRDTTAALSRALAELYRINEFRQRATTDDEWVSAKIMVLESDRGFHHLIVELAENSQLE